jgi:hypothetical protein
MKSYCTISLALARLFNLFIFGCSCASVFAAEPSADRVVVLMSVDGLANFYLQDPTVEMPTIRKLASEGAVAAGMHASDPHRHLAEPHHVGDGRFAGAPRRRRQQLLRPHER